MQNTADPMERARELFAESGLTLDELGRRMGYSDDAARKSAWQFLNKSSDPRVSMVQKFASAVGVSIIELFDEQRSPKKKGRSK
jgi:transcriptional regulator with XRE-family HTH domain